MLFVGCLVVGLRPPQVCVAEAGFFVEEPLAELRWDDAVGVGRACAGPQLANFPEKVDQRELRVPVLSLRRQKRANSERLGGSVRAPSATLMAGKKKDHDQGRALSGVLRHGHGFSEVVWDSEGWFEEFELMKNQKLRTAKVTRDRIRELVEEDRRRGTNRFESKSENRNVYYRATSGWSLKNFEPSNALKEVRAKKLPHYLYHSTQENLRDKIVRDGPAQDTIAIWQWTRR